MTGYTKYLKVMEGLFCIPKPLLDYDYRSLELDLFSLIKNK